MKTLAFIIVVGFGSPRAIPPGLLSNKYLWHRESDHALTGKLRESGHSPEMTSFHLYGNNTCYPKVIQLNVDGKGEGRGGKRPRIGSYSEEDIISVDKPSGN